MSSLKNRVQLIGRAGQDPEVVIFGDNKKKATFPIAVNEIYYNDKGEKVENVYWHTLVLWGKVAEIAEKFVTKGKEIAIEGKLTSRSYEDQDKNKKYVTEVIVQELLLLGK